MTTAPPISVFRKLAYSTGYLGTMLTGELAAMWIIFFYAPPQGMVYAPIALVGAVVFFGRAVDAIADPLVGYFSDRSRSRFGRRLPFIALGAPFLALALILMFHPPIADTSVLNAIYLAIVLGFFWIFYTIVVAPHLALFPELVTSNKDRINLATYLAIFGVLGLFIAFLGSGFLIAQFNFGIMAMVMASIAFISFAVPVIFIRETPWSKAKETTLTLRAALTHCFANKPFLYYALGSGVFRTMAFSMIIAAVPFIVTVLMGAGPEWAGYASGLTIGVALLSFPLVNYLSKQFGKKAVFASSILLFSILAFMLPTIGMTPIPAFYHGLILMGLMGLPISCVLLLPHALTADIIDHDETLTGFRREAIYHGVHGFVSKTAIGLAALILTQLLHLFGKTAADPLGIVLAGPVAGILALTGFLVFLKYPFPR